MFYDFTKDEPVAILKDELNTFYYFKVSSHNAEDIINFISNKNSVKNTVYNIIIDLFNNTEAKIEKLTIEKYEKDEYSGYFQIILNGKLFYYYMTSDDIILLSKMFNIEIEVDPAIFYEIIEKSQKEYANINKYQTLFHEN